MVREEARDARAAWQAVMQLFLGEAMHDRLHDAVDAIGLPHPGSMKALMLLDPDDPPPMRALARDMPCDASYVTVLVDVLEELGYVERRPSPVDRRVKLVQLTDKGEAAKQQALEIINTPPPAMERLSPSEARALARIVGKLL